MSDPELSEAAHFKDSCNYSVETSKQFLTFGAGGLAFIVGLALTPDSSVNNVYYWSFGLFVGSLVLGLLYIMNIVGHISQSKNYDVYTPRLRWLGLSQILAVFGGVVTLGIVVLGTIRNRHAAAPATAPFELTASGRSVRYAPPPGAAIVVKVSPSGEVDLRIDVPKPTVPR